MKTVVIRHHFVHRPDGQMHERNNGQVTYRETTKWTEEFAQSKQLDINENAAYKKIKLYTCSGLKKCWTIFI
jgi:hypothetical protein